MAKLPKEKRRKLVILLVIAAVGWFVWQNRQAKQEHGGTTVKEHAGKEHAGTSTP
jgi:predicted negative regulator of RcsB-dependent stress response